MPTPAHLSVTAILLLSCAGLSQDPGPITLTAGEHRFSSLIELAEKLHGKAIAADERALGPRLAQRIVLQNALELDAASAADLVSELLFSRSILIGTAGEQLQAFAYSGRGPQPSAIEREPDAILLRPHRMELVTTKIASGEQMQIRVNVLRPFLASIGRGPGIKITPMAEQLQLTGPTDQIVLALQLLALADGDPVPPQAPIRWRDDKTLPWPGGEMDPERFVELFCRTLRANVIGEARTVSTMDLGEPAALSAADWFARATEVAHAAKLLLAPILPEQRVFAIGPVGGDVEQRLAIQPMEEVRNGHAITPVLTVYELQRVPSVLAANMLRPKLSGKRVTVGSLDAASRLVISGLRHEVSQAIEAMIELDSK